MFRFPLLLSLLTLSFAISAREMPKVSFVSPSIVRIQWAPDSAASLLSDAANRTGACIYSPQQVDVTVTETPQAIIYSSPALSVIADRATSALTFIDRATGRTLLSEAPDSPRQMSLQPLTVTLYDDASARLVDTANGKVTVKDVISTDTVGFNRQFRLNLLLNPDKAIYGLGSHMEDYMNLLGKTVYLVHHNLKAAIPVITSTDGFGLFFDAGCAMTFASDSLPGPDGRIPASLMMEAADQLDYYFILGPRMADVTAGYRFLTGPVSLPPRYLFGYIQSRERYASSDQIIATLHEYRRRNVPIDMIVQDWNYWPEGWGYMKMDPRFYPDPAALADSVHALNAKIMVSIWPNPQYCPQEADFRQRGFMLEHSVYDAFNPDARAYYWSWADREFFSRGFDAWWCDSSEPLDGDWNSVPQTPDGHPYSWDDQQLRYTLNRDILASALGHKRVNLYSLNHSRGIYEGQRAATDRKRVVNLTRSTFPGQQRYGTVVWNGDTHASWESFRQQIPSGLNYMATGNPYWTVDVGAFFTRKGHQWFWCGDFPEGAADPAYREFYLRMFQWATFLPILRSHGTDTPREIWQFGEPGQPVYDAILSMIRLRYSLLPYIYSLAAAQTFGDYTMARPIAFDFPDDVAAADIKDQYLFGDILVCPVTSPGVDARPVYLPTDSTSTPWIDFWTGQSYAPGQTILAPAPLSRLPLYVRAGSIIPTVDQPVDYAEAQASLPVTINVYPGADASFSLYDDAGDSYDYEKGEYSLIPISWDDSTHTLSLDAMQGNFSSPLPRQFIIRTPSSSHTLTYTGSPLSLPL